MQISQGFKRGWPFGLALIAVVVGSVSFALRAGNRDLERGESEEEELAYAEEAVRWRNLSNKDESGRIPPGARAMALDHRRANLRLKSSGMLPSPRLDRTKWKSQGPFNTGGRTRSISINPANPLDILIGSVSGGIWRTLDGGNSWTPVSDYMANLSIGCIARSPQNPQVIYAGTGEGQFNGDAIQGAGIFKSTDGGANWAQIPSTVSFISVNRISINPSNPNILLASLRYGGLYRSTDAGVTWNPSLWAQGSFDVQFNPADGSKAVGHIIDYAGDWLHRAVYSIDGGATFLPSTGPLNNVAGFNNRIELAYAASSPNIVYASCAAFGGKVYKSVDGGQSYALATGSSTTGTSWYANTLWVSPTDPNAIMVGGTHILRSIDGGFSFAQVSEGYIQTVQPHPDIHEAVSDPGFDGVNNRRVYWGTDGGLFRTDDFLAASMFGGWVSLNLGYTTTQFYGAQGVGSRLVGGTQDNGTLQIDIPGTAKMEFGGDGGWCAIDPTDPNYIYGEYVALQIHRSTSGGNFASYIYYGITDAGTNANFIAPFILDPNNPNRMWAGGLSLWRSDNVKAPTPTWTAARGPGSALISAIAVAPGNPDIVWVGQNDGQLSMTTNGTAVSPTWTPIDDNGAKNPLPGRYLTRILIDPANSQIVYASFGGFSPDNLWMTTNGGGTWTDISGIGNTGLPHAPIRGIARHPTHPTWLYVGTEVGIFTSEVGGNTWSAQNEGPASVSVDELTFIPGSSTLLAATHGRGLFTIDLADATFVPAGISLSPKTVWGPAGSTGTVTLSAPAGAGGASVSLSSSLPAAVVPPTVTVAAGATKANFPITTSNTGYTTLFPIISAVAGGTTKSATMELRPDDGALFGSQVVPSGIVAGQSYDVTVVMQNSGKTTWTAAEGFKLSSTNPTDNKTWGVNRVFLSVSDSIAPGQTKAFKFKVYAPTTAGSYNFQWKMRDEGVGTFGSASTNLSIPVTVRQHAARYVGQTVPTSVKAGSTFGVIVEMRNVGTNVWSQAAGYTLRPEPGYQTWGITTIPLGPADSIPQAASKVFTFSCTAPATPGSYTMRWRMHRAASAFTGFFGDRTTTKTINVIP